MKPACILYRHAIHPFLPTRNRVQAFKMHIYVRKNGVQINDIHWNTPRFPTRKVGLTVSYDTNIFYICILLGINSTPIEYKLCTPFFWLGDGRITNGYSIHLYRKGHDHEQWLWHMTFLSNGGNPSIGTGNKHFSLSRGNPSIGTGNKHFSLNRGNPSIGTGNRHFSLNRGNPLVGTGNKHFSRVEETRSKWIREITSLSNRGQNYAPLSSYTDSLRYVHIWGGYVTTYLTITTGYRNKYIYNNNSLL